MQIFYLEEFLLGYGFYFFEYFLFCRWKTWKFEFVFSLSRTDAFHNQNIFELVESLDGHGLDENINDCIQTYWQI